MGIGNRLIDDVPVESVRPAAANMLELVAELDRLERQCLRFPSAVNVKSVVAAQAAVKRAYRALA